MQGIDLAVTAFKPDLIVLFTLPIFFAESALEKMKVAEPTRPEPGVVWCHLMPFEPTQHHAPPVGKQQQQ
jgi:hypothetical protein